MRDQEGYKKSQAKRFFGGEVVDARNRIKKAYRFFKPFVRPEEPVLDIGTRDGWLVEYLKRKKFHSVQGIELTEDAVKYAQSQGRNVIWGDVHDLSAFETEGYGSVLMIHSLEHCHDPQKAVEGVHRVLRPGGVFVIEVPLETKVNYEYAHYCKFEGIHDVVQLLDKSRFELLREKTYQPDPKRHPRLKHLMCAFRRRDAK